MEWYGSVAAVVPPMMQLVPLTMTWKLQMVPPMMVLMARMAPLLRGHDAATCWE